MNSSKIPKIETDRLILRAHHISDFPLSASMWADPKVVEFIGGKPFSEQQSWARFLNYLGHWDVMGFGYWAVEEKSTGKFIGEIGFADFKRDMTPSIQGIPELGWVLSPSFHGRGFATEGVRAAIEWEKTHLKSDKIACIITPGNMASIHVAEKCGFQKSCNARYQESELHLFFKTRSMKQTRT